MRLLSFAGGLARGLMRLATLCGASGLVSCGMIAGVDDVRLANDVSDAGGAHDASGDGGTSATGCTKLHGAPMVLMSEAKPPFCIDVRETTVAEFNDFLIADGEPFDAPSYCAPKAALRPLRVDDVTKQALPATGMIWCYAQAYCKWAGKRLCGAIGGGEVPYPTEDVHNEWTFACVNGKLNYTFPYGSTYDATKCNTEGTHQASAPGSFPACHGVSEPFASVLDMSGNAPEFDGYVHFTDDGVPDSVRQRGKGSGDVPGSQSCTSADAFSYEWATSEVAIRCCADP